MRAVVRFAFLALMPTLANSLHSAAIATASRRAVSLRCAAAATNPAVLGWPEKYGGSKKPDFILHDSFTVEKAEYSKLIELDVAEWPTWTTKGNDRWMEDVTRKDKEMPYGELSYLLSGQLEIVPKDTGVPVFVNPGDFVTFPEGFVSDWTVRKELTWHYFLY